MNHKQHIQELKRFQLERLILFTDAVFAIAITLLVLEIKVPTMPSGFTESDLKNALLRQIPQWIGFVISFGVIGRYWVAHHDMFLYVENKTSKLVFLNFLFLASIVVMPFTSGAYSFYVDYNTPFLIYCFNVASTGLIQTMLWREITNPKSKVSLHPIDGFVKKSFLLRCLVAPFVFFCSGIIAINGFPNPKLAFLVSRSFFMMIFILLFLLKKYYAKYDKS
jgi:uncharacterized membrane protein